jgi:hypothetical protein
MKDESDNLLDRVRPRRSPDELRSEILSLVEQELRSGPVTERRPRLLKTVLLGIVAAVALNAWVTHRNDAKLAKLYGREQLPAAIQNLGQIIESATDAQTARWCTRFLIPERRKIDPDSLRREQSLLAERANL